MKEAVLIQRQMEEDPLGKLRFTSVNYLFFSARLTFYHTAPVKMAFTTINFNDSVGFETTVTAEKIATIYRFAGRITNSLLGPKRTRFGILCAEIGRVCCIDKIVVGMRFNGIPLRENLIPLVAYYNLGSAVKFWFESITHFTESGQLLPASFLGTLSWYPVALALLNHVVLHSLKEN